MWPRRAVSTFCVSGRSTHTCCDTGAAGRVLQHPIYVDAPGDYHTCHLARLTRYVAKIDRSPPS